MSRASSIAGETRAQNRLRAEPAMQAAARQVGAVLLPVFPEEVFDCDMPDWRLPPGSDCVKWNPNFSPVTELLDARGGLHPVLPVDTPDWYYARLARRGDDLFLLVPKVIRRQVDRREECECGAMPQPIPPMRPRVVFVVDGTPKTPPQRIEVPVTEDYVNFQCRAYLL